MGLDTDFHSHVSYSSALEMVRAARGKGLRVLGLSEHVFQMREVRPLLAHIPLEGGEMELQTYVKNVQEAALSQDFDVRLGLEVDFIPEKQEAIQALLQGYPWDFLIGSVHQIDGILFEESPAWSSVAEGERAWRRYLALLSQAVSTRQFSVVSHPVRLFLTNRYLPSDLDEQLEQLAAEAARCDVALEVNGFDVANYPEMVRRLLQACAHQGAPISVGSDAHYPHGLAALHARSEQLLREAGIRTVRIWRRLAGENYAL
jgi:histidinol-phosphatase (PHP family)